MGFITSLQYKKDAHNISQYNDLIPLKERQGQYVTCYFFTVLPFNISAFPAPDVQCL